MTDTAQTARKRMITPSAALTVFVIIYFVGLTIYLGIYGGWTTPDLYLPGLLVIALALGRGFRFFADWGPFIGLLIAYEALRGGARTLNQNTNWTALAHADHVIGLGSHPVIKLQEWLYRPGLDPLNLAVTAGYLGQFVIPVGVAFIFWMRDRRIYWEFTGGLLLVSFAAFVTFLAFPAAPPWMAAEYGILPPVSRVVQETLGQFVHPGLVQTTWQHLGSNEVAPFPSLHAAWPTLVALALWTRMRPSPWRWTPFLYPLFMGFAVVYAGEHYAIDVLGGYAYAFVGWCAVRGIASWLEGQQPAWLSAAAEMSSGMLPHWPARSDVPGPVREPIDAPAAAVSASDTPEVRSKK